MAWMMVENFNWSRTVSAATVCSLSRACGGGLGWGCLTRTPMRMVRAPTRHALRARRPPPQAGEARKASMRLVPIVRRARVDLQWQRQDYGRERRVLHDMLHDRQRRRHLVVGHLEDQFVMHLQ